MDRSPRRLLLLMLIGLSAAPVLAQEHMLSIGVAGEKFKLDPQFTIAVDGTVIGEGTVDNALDTTAGQVLRGVADPSVLVTTRSFPIPAALLADGAMLTVTFTGGSYDAQTGADTNLYIASLAIDGRPLALDEAKIADGANPDSTVVLVGGMLGLHANGATASFTLDPAPPAVDTTEAEPAAAEVPAEPETPVMPTTQAEPAVEPAPAAAPEPVCDVATTLAITGFGNNGLTLDDGARAALDALAARLAGQDCSIELVGYASTSGSDRANRRISLARAELVLEHLVAAGIAAERITPTGAGETRQFGDSQQSNRRVVVTVAATR